MNNIFSLYASAPSTTEEVSTSSRSDSLISMSSSHSENSSVCSYASQETPEARRFRREFRMQQVELMELTALGLHKGKTLTLDLGLIRKMEEQNMELSNQSIRGSSNQRPRGRPSFSQRVGLKEAPRQSLVKSSPQAA